MTEKVDLNLPGYDEKFKHEDNSSDSSSVTASDIQPKIKRGLLDRVQGIFDVF